MLLRLSLLFEMLSVVVCIHRLYNRKVQFDVSAIVVVLGGTAVFDMINMYELNAVYTILVYGLVEGYCIYRFRDSVFGAAICIFLVVVFLLTIQFLFTLPIKFFTVLGADERGVVINVLAFISCMWVMPKCKVFILYKMIKKYRGFLLLIVLSVLGVSLLLQFWQRTRGIIYLEVFIVVIPIIILILVLLGKWGLAQNEKQEVEKELHAALSMQEKQDELVKEVRLRQHEFKNHLAAIMATHYTYKSYENLVNAQRQYYGELVDENKYNDLLVLGNAILSGFLYEKFQEIESKNIEVQYKIRGKLSSSLVPAHYLIEMIGILLDNAEQAVQEKPLKRIICFSFCDEGNRYLFKISNPFYYVGYDEMESWFQMGKSTKGDGRGLGLHRVKNICEEHGCDIICKNIDAENENWIEFIIKMEKAG